MPYVRVQQSVLPLIAAMLILTVGGGTGRADDVYKSVDEQGKVIYSETPPPGAVKSERIKTGPKPTAEQIREAEERLKALEETTAELEQERKAREVERARRETEERERQALVPPPPVYVPVPVPIFRGKPPFHRQHPPRRPPENEPEPPRRRIPR